jgi:hypothetical protein
MKPDSEIKKGVAGPRQVASVPPLIDRARKVSWTIISGHCVIVFC